MVHKKNILAALIFIPSILFAQIELEKHILGASVGFSFLGSAPQIGLNHEYPVSLKELGIASSGIIGVGGICRYWKYSEKFVDVEWDYINILFGVQTNYHFYMFNDKIDPWLGVILAYDIGDADATVKSVNYTIGDDTHGGFWIGANAGIRYWLTLNMGLNLRIGFGTLQYGSLEFGFDYKFN